MVSTTTAANPVAATPAGAAEAFMPLTITHLVLIALAIVATIVMIWWGSQLKQRRDAERREIEERARTEAERPSVPPAPSIAREAVAPAPIAPPPVDIAPPPPEPAPMPEPVVVATPAPIAPSPPPLVDTEVPGMPPVMPVPAPTPGPAVDLQDLTTLKGLGPKVAGQLNALGIVTVADLAELSADRAQAIDAQLGAFTGRMGRDRWIEQAQLLIAGDRAGYEAKFGKLGG
ncbi:hypothetical protein [Sphingomonas qomolangmaensis]|uniref:Flap endonuclease-1-like 5' DNA nuclease n=1 Tax=Sphingomonas qomolangmaensis TaxID=2918765 RepID=A0ABY5L7I6_9SPHN|nr:hypothetical protein [Sphingomonas qomolangmaensis]UUL81558.1 hypothetical protein NMP03_10090 [Sphingomonas qomolangmaensis]